MSFDGIGRIQSIRLMWDQGSLLKSVEVIGSRGKNWPVRDGKDQLKAISSSLDTSIASSMNGASISGERQGRSTVQGSKPSLQNSISRSVEQEDSPSKPFAPRASAKPPQRDFQDIFTASADPARERSESPSKSTFKRAGANKNYHDVRLFSEAPPDSREAMSPERSESPSKSNFKRAGASKNFHDVRLFSEEKPKPRDPMSPERSESPSGSSFKRAGASKNYHDVRLFDDSPSNPRDPTSPEKGMKAHPKKYNHFEFDEEPPSLQNKGDDKASKHASQWDFSDFVTPEKPRKRTNPKNERNFGWSDYEEEAKQPTVHRQDKPKPRKDAGSQFEISDEATPKAKSFDKPRTHEGSQRLSLYDDHVNIGDPDKTSKTADSTEKMPLGNITNVNPAGQKKTFGSQFEIEDKSPSVARTEVSGRNFPETRKKVAKGMESNWSMYDESPPPEKAKGINVQGDGMGSRKAPTEKSWWEFE